MSVSRVLVPLSIQPNATMTFLGLGSNIEPRVNHIDAAVRDLQCVFPSEFQVSSYYRTKPYKGLKQNFYVNCCVAFSTSKPVQDILCQTQYMERKTGRIRSYNPWESREIDIDILLHGEDEYRFSNLIIPHYDLQNRDFFLIPLIELDKSLINPSSGNTLVEELGNLPSDLKTVVEKMGRGM